MSNAVRHGCHDLGRELHGFGDGLGQRQSAGFLRVCRVLGFVLFHLIHHRARRQICQWQTMHMLLQMRFHLPLGFNDKAQTEFVATELSSQVTQPEGARIPQRIEHTGKRTQIG